MPHREEKRTACLTRLVVERVRLVAMNDPATGSRAIATINRNSNLVLAILHRLPPGKFGHVFADGLATFGVAMLIGIEPAAYLIAKALPDIRFEGRNANDNPLITGPVSEEELQRRVRRHFRAMGYTLD